MDDLKKRQVSVRTTEKIFSRLHLCSFSGNEAVTTIVARLLKSELLNPPQTASTVRIAGRDERFEKRLTFYVDIDDWNNFKSQCLQLRIRPATRINQLLLQYLEENRKIWQEQEETI